MRLILRSLLVLLVLVAAPVFACDAPATICPSRGALALIERGHPRGVLTDPADDPGVLRAAANLRADLGRVGGGAQGATGIIAGTIGHDAVIDRLIREGRLDVRGLTGQWEAYAWQVVEHPTPGVVRALVIAGADRRGTIFGIYDLSRAIGVSPWSWWADVPVAHRDRLFVTAGRRIDRPRVRYRGIFINDEDPALLGWARAAFGGFNHAFYERVFDLILRSRANLLWPAMWGKSFFEDDPENGRLANEMGVIVGTSHHEPLMRAHVDWEHHGQGPWDYTQNAERLRQFWREGLERTQGQERIVTIGMRGDGDRPMTEGTATQLLERIVADQRRLIEAVTRRPAAETPQVWALYKEVQDYYDAGMRVPDDVTLLFSDDNWGNIRRLPQPGAARAGGYGIYYHFDYVGGPRNYKWINTTQIGRVWEQMQQAYAFGARQLWIVNVGDIKPLEYPTAFFLDLAWNPEAMPLERLAAYPTNWAAAQFGPIQAPVIGQLLSLYGRYAARRKPELLAANSYSLGEWRQVIGEWDALERDASAMRDQLPEMYRDAYFELILHPILANANLHRLYQAVAEGRAADAARLFARDAEIRRLYEVETAHGRWTQMMAQTHIGYTSWQQPPADVMPRVPQPPAPEPPPVLASVDARDYSARIGDWRIIPYLGLNASSVAFFPFTAPAQRPGGRGPHLDYRVRLAEGGEAALQITLSPTLDFRAQDGLRYAVSIDDGPIETVNVNGHVTDADWSRAVIENSWRRTTWHRLAAGEHVIHLWAVDPGLVFQRLQLVGP
ncbi:MAG: glycosyl hydrolase 115 family protein [Sphingomonadaceae bacterium]|nr:glycosyl hydrolase 115 family protein [Sphingomonadaceae bacterium]